MELGVGAALCRSGEPGRAKEDARTKGLLGAENVFVPLCDEAVADLVCKNSASPSLKTDTGARLWMCVPVGPALQRLRWGMASLTA